LGRIRFEFDPLGPTESRSRFQRMQNSFRCWDTAESIRKLPAVKTVWKGIISLYSGLAESNASTRQMRLTSFVLERCPSGVVSNIVKANQRLIMGSQRSSSGSWVVKQLMAAAIMHFARSCASRFPFVLSVIRSARRMKSTRWKMAGFAGRERA